MSNFETSTTVGGQGDIHLAGLPFTPGTEVEVVVTPKPATAAKSDERLAALFHALDHAHNQAPIGPLRRDELYYRDDVR